MRWTLSLRALLRVAYADLRHHKLQSALIVIIILGATGALALAVNVRRGAHEPWQRAFDATQGAHITFWSMPDRDGQSSDLSRLSALPGVVATDGPRPELWDTSLVFDGQADRVNVQSADDDGASRAVSRPALAQGSWLGDGVGDVVLDRGYASSRHIHVGDTVQIASVTGLTSLRVVGLVIEPWRGLYTDSEPLIFVRPATFATLDPDQSHWSASYSVRLAQPDQADAVLAAAPRLQGPGDLGVQSWQDVEASYVNWNNVYAVFLGVFSVMALLACGLIISNLIAGRVLAQYRDIGLLKALGMTPGQVTLVFLLEHMLLALVGGLLGLLGAFALAPMFLHKLTVALNTTATATIEPALALALLLGVLMLTAVFTLLPALRGGRVSAITAITHGLAPARTRPSWLARLALALRLPTAVVFGVKDVFAQRGRAILTVVALTLTVVTLVFALSAESTIRNLLNHPELQGEPFDLTLQSQRFSPSEISQLLSAHPDIAYFYSRTYYQGTHSSAGRRQAFPIRALDGNWQAATYAIREGRMFSAPGEAIVGRGLLDELGVHVGDQLDILVNGQPLTVRIVGRYLEDDNDGRVMQISAATPLPAATALGPGDFAIKLRSGVNADNARLQLLAAADYEPDIVVEHGGATPPEATALRWIVFGLSGVLLVIGLINLLATALLSVRERQREFGVAKTLGLTPGQLVTSVASGAGTLALLATLLGIPLGLLNSWLLFKLVAEHMLNAQPDMYAAPGPGWLALLTLGLLCVALLASAVPARVAARVRPADALRYS
jgi:putative ABC transport system permease protein